MNKVKHIKFEEIKNLKQGDIVFLDKEKMTYTVQPVPVSEDSTDIEHVAIVVKDFAPYLIEGVHIYRNLEEVTLEVKDILIEDGEYSKIEVNKTTNMFKYINESEQPVPAEEPEVGIVKPEKEATKQGKK